MTSVFQSSIWLQCYLKKVTDCIASMPTSGSSSSESEPDGEAVGSPELPGGATPPPTPQHAVVASSKSEPLCAAFAGDLCRCEVCEKPCPKKKRVLLVTSTRCTKCNIVLLCFCFCSVNHNNIIYCFCFSALPSCHIQCSGLHSCALPTPPSANVSMSRASAQGKTNPWLTWRRTTMSLDSDWEPVCLIFVTAPTPRSNVITCQHHGWQVSMWHIKTV